MKKTIKYLLILFLLSGAINSSAQMVLMDKLHESKKKRSEYKQEMSFSQFIKELKKAANKGENYTLENCAITYEARVDSQYINLEPGMISDYEKVLVIDETINFSEGSLVTLSNCYFDYEGDIRISKIGFWNLELSNIYSLHLLHLDSITASRRLKASDLKGLKITHSNINSLHTSISDSIYDLMDFEHISYYSGIELISNKITHCSIYNTPQFNISDNTISFLEIGGKVFDFSKIFNNIFTVDLRNWMSIRQTDDHTININLRSGIAIQGNIKELQIEGNIGKSIKQLENDSTIEIIKRYNSSNNVGSTIFFNNENEKYEFNKLGNGVWSMELFTPKQLEFLEKLNKEDDSLRITYKAFPEIYIVDSEFDLLRFHNDTFAVISIQKNIIKKELSFKKMCADSILVFNKNNLPTIERTKLDRTIFKNIGFKHSSKSYYGNEDYHQIKELLDNEGYNSRLDELIITHRKFINILNQQGSSAKKIGVLKLKDIQTNMQMHEYYKEPSINTWFNWQGFEFLRWYSDYGMNPFKALTYCFLAMLYFALFYFFFYSDWDKIDRGFLIKRFNNVMDYFTTEKRIEDFYSSTHDKEMTTFTEFKETLDKNKVYMPGMLASLAKPIYQISLLRYRLLNFSYKKVEFMAGRKWVNLEKKDRYWIGALTFFLTLTYIIYLIFIRALNSIVLSINAFSTLGFGTIPVRGFTKYVAIIEGFIGWFMLSVFIVSLLSQMMSV